MGMVMAANRLNFQEMRGFRAHVRMTTLIPSVRGALQDVPRKFGEFVEEKDAAMREAYLAGWIRAAATTATCDCRLMRRTKRRLGDQSVAAVRGAIDF